MKRYEYNKPHNLAALGAEFVAAIPALAPTPTGFEGAMSSPFALSDAGSNIYVEVPDSVAQADVTAVINAHTNPPAPTPIVIDYSDAASDTDRAALVTAISNLHDYLALASPSAGQSTAALKVLIRVVLALLRRLVG